MKGELIDWLQQARGVCAAVIINAGAYTHTSIAILDALLALDMPVIEVHISNIFRREAFRHHSYVSQAASGVLCGFGAFGYELALDAAAHALRPASRGSNVGNANMTDHETQVQLRCRNRASTWPDAVWTYRSPRSNTKTKRCACGSRGR